MSREGGAVEGADIARDQVTELYVSNPPISVTIGYLTKVCIR